MSHDRDKITYTKQLATLRPMGQGGTADSPISNKKRCLGRMRGPDEAHFNETFHVAWESYRSGPHEGRLCSDNGQLSHPIQKKKRERKKNQLISMCLGRRRLDDGQ